MGSHAVHEEEANQKHTPGLQFQEASQVWLDAWQIRTARSTGKFDRQRLGHHTVVHQLTLYVDELG
jgi:hypothetical protein